MGLSWKISKKVNLKGQLQYNNIKAMSYTANNNILATSGFNWQIMKKITLQYTMTANVLRFGSEIPGSSLTPPYSGIPQYLESTVRTGLQYKW